MGVIALLLFVMLAASARRDQSGTTPHPTGLDPVPPDIHDAADRARRDAARKARQAANSGHPADQKAASDAQKAAATLTKASQVVTQQAAATPPPWPAAPPSGLAPWPQGWEFASPTPQAAVIRANQLIPVLWKKGASARTVENTGGQWLSYVASPMGAGGKIKGVVVYRQKLRANA